MQVQQCRLWGIAVARCLNAVFGACINFLVNYSSTDGVSGSLITSQHTKQGTGQVTGKPSQNLAFFVLFTMKGRRMTLTKESIMTEFLNFDINLYQALGLIIHKAALGHC